MTAPTKTPVSVATLAGASKFQQSKKILTIALHRINAIFCMRMFCLGDLLPLMVAVLLLTVEMSK